MKEAVREGMAMRRFRSGTGSLRKADFQLSGRFRATGASLVLLGVLGCALIGSSWAQTRRIERVPAAGSPGSGARLALVIGNNAYPAMPLRNAVNDARSVAAVLTEKGFSVESYSDLGIADTERAVARFVGRLGSGDVGLFFYAGHGMQIAGENYLVPVDFRANDEIDAKRNSYPAQDLVEKMEQSGSRLNIVVLDACRDNPFRATRSGTRGLGQMMGGRGTFIAFSAGPGQTAADNPGAANSLFTSNLLDSIRQPGLSLNQVFDRTRAAVDTASAHEQLPWSQTSVIGDFYFSPESAAVDSPAQVVEPSIAVDAVTATGTVRVTVNVAGAEILLDGRSVARSQGPSTVTLDNVPIGYRRIEVTKAGYRSFDKQVAVRKGSSVEVDGWLEPLAAANPAASSSAALDPPSGDSARPTVSRISDPGSSRAPSAGEEWTNSLGMKFVYVPAGRFMMGSPPNEDGRFDDETQHQVTLTEGYWLGKYEVTQGQWEAVMGSNPSYFKNCGKDCPVEQVSWNDVQDFIKRMNNRGDGYQYRLPTEAEWEYAARAGSTGPYGGSGKLDEMGWYSDNSGAETHPVGQKQVNAWGLYDTHGNVWEWVSDWYGGYPTGSVTDPKGPSSGSYRVLRGGSWGLYAQDCRSANRGSGDPGARGSDLGFRLLRTYR